MNWKGKRIFVTGGTGFIGSHLCRRLSDLGAVVLRLCHERKPEYLQNAIDVYGNVVGISTQKWLKGILAPFRPEIVFHLAAQPLVQKAMAEPHDTLQTNIDGTYNVLQACVGLHDLKAFVHVSTDKVYGDFDRAVSETDGLHGVNHPYNTSKLCGDILAQMYAHAFGVPVIIARSGNIYGGGDRSPDRLIPQTILSTLKGERVPIRSNGSPERDYIYVDDVVDAYLLLAETVYWRSPILWGSAVNLGSEVPMSVMDVVHEILGAMNRVDLAPKIENTARLEIPYQHLDWSYAKSLGWTPKTSFSEGLEKTISWYKEYYNEQS